MVGLLSLPPPLLTRILSLLSCPHRAAFLLVSTYARKLGSCPALWWDVSAVSRSRLQSDGLEPLLALHRFSQLAVLDLGQLRLQFSAPLARQLLAWFHNNSRLTRVCLAGNDLSGLPAFPLATSLARCPVLQLSDTRLNTEQLNSLLGKCAGGRYTSHLDLSFNDLSHVNLELLEAGARGLQSLGLAHTDLSNLQARAILLAVNDSKLVELDLSGADLTGCSLDNIGLNFELTRLTLSEVRLQPERLDRVLTNLGLLSSLAHLTLSGSVLHAADPILFSDAVVRVRRVELNFCWLYRDHIEFLLDAITEKTALRHLDLSGNHFEGVNRDLLLEGARYLTSLRLEWANLAGEQLETLIFDTDQLVGLTIILNHFELLDNHLDLHRAAKLNPAIQLNQAEGNKEAVVKELSSSCY